MSRPQPEATARSTAPQHSLSARQVATSKSNQEIEAATGEGTHETNSYTPVSQFAECVVEFIAGKVAVNFSKVTKCPECSRIALVTSGKRGLVLAEDAGGLHSLTQNILHLCTIEKKGASAKLRQGGQKRPKLAPKAAD
ncbi:uncharacterized protein ISCGN_010300 [Ixodes scapularis]